VGSAAVWAVIHPIFFAVFCSELVRLFRVVASEVGLAITPALYARTSGGGGGVSHAQSIG